MTYDYDLMSDLTFTLAFGEKVYIKVNGVISTSLLSVKIEAGASYIVQSSLDSTEAFEGYTSHSDGIWENIVIDGVSYSEVTFDISSLSFRCPNFLYINNTSVSQAIKVSLRGNR